jgi:hypothetical protein
MESHHCPAHLHPLLLEPADQTERWKFFKEHRQAGILMCICFQFLWHCREKQQFKEPNPDTTFVVTRDNAMNWDEGLKTGRLSFLIPTSTPNFLPSRASTFLKLSGTCISITCLAPLGIL